MPIKKTDVYLPPAAPNPGFSHNDNKADRTWLRRMIHKVKTSLRHLQHKQNKYQRLNNKELTERTAQVQNDQLPMTTQYTIDIPPPQDPAAKKQLAIDATIAAYPYHQSTNAITEAGNIDPVSTTPPHWQKLTTLVDTLALHTGLTLDREKGLLYDKKTGLTAYLLQQPETKEIRLVFGGTTSGLYTGGMIKRSLMVNRQFTLAQWRSNIRNALGLKSTGNFEQAKQLTTVLQQQLEQTPTYKGYRLVLSGHSKGGTEATYAALCQHPPLEAKVFSSAELHQQLINQIPPENIKQACSLITNVTIKGDPIPHMHKVLPTKLRALGAQMTLQPAHRYNLERHDSFVKHVRYFAEKS